MIKVSLTFTCLSLDQSPNRTSENQIEINSRRTKIIITGPILHFDPGHASGNNNMINKNIIPFHLL